MRWRSSYAINVCRALLPVCALAAAGCYTTSAARARAVQLTKDLDGYRQDQAARLDQINRQYRFDYTHLIEDITRLRQVQLRQMFDLASQDAADQILTEWERQTLPRRIYDRFRQALDERRKELLEADAGIDAARAAYAQAYQQVQLNLSRLKAAQAGTESLAVPEDRTRTTADFIQTLGRIYGKLQDQAKTSTSGQ